MPRFIAICSVLLLFGCSSGDSRRDELQESFSALVTQVGSETQTPGISLHVISEKHGSFSVNWGMADLVSETPVGRDQLFRIGSLTKTFTGAAVLRLAEEGMVELDAPASDYLELENGNDLLSTISVRNLLNMSSGLPEYLTEPFIISSILPDPLRNWHPAELLALAFDPASEPLFPPGSDFFYANTNYLLLGLLIEAVSGQSYAEYLNVEFLEPLGLSNTRANNDATIPEELARGYFDFAEDEQYEDWTQMHMSYVWTAGCIVSTARDTAVWMDALARGDLMGEELRSLLFKGQQIVEGVVYGGGIVVEEGFGIGHNGTVIGYHADAWHDPVSATTVTVLSNTNAPLSGDGRDPTREIVEGVFTRLRGTD